MKSMLSILEERGYINQIVGYWPPLHNLEQRISDCLQLEAGPG